MLATHQQEFAELLPALSYDRVVGIHQGKKLYLSQVLKFIFNERIPTQPQKKVNKAPAAHYVSRGWVHLGMDKQDLQEQKQTVWLRSVSTLLKKVHSGYQYMTYGTFNITKNRTMYDRCKKRLNSVQAFVIDIDNKDIPLQDIIEFSTAHGLNPSFINATPNGYHVWFVFSMGNDAIGPHMKDGQRTKIGEVYNKINRTLVQLFKDGFPAEGNKKTVDYVFGGERYIRIPLNIVFWGETNYTFGDLIKYSMNHAAESEKANNKRNNASGKVLSFIPKNRIFKDPAIQKLMSEAPVKGQRRNTAFTISLLCKEAGYSIEKCIKTLKHWYKSVHFDKNDFQLQEVLREVNSAFNGDKRVSPAWIYNLTGLFPCIYFSKKKTKEERTYETLQDVANAFLTLLQKHNGELITSTRDAMKLIDESSKHNFDRVISFLISKKLITKEVQGRGRYAKTIYKLVTQEPEKPKNSKPKNNIIPFPLSLGSDLNLNAPKTYTLYSFYFLGGVGGASPRDRSSPG